jgi:holin-like protein
MICKESHSLTRRDRRSYYGKALRFSHDQENKQEFREPGTPATRQFVFAELGCNPNDRGAAMIGAFLVLITCELVGEIVRGALDLPIPGPVIGMFLLASVLVVRDRLDRPATPEALDRTAGALISHMGLLFVPAGVGIIAQAGLLRSQWLPIVAGLVGSTVLGLAVTGLVMHWTNRPRDQTHSRELGAGRSGLVGRQGSAS